MANTIAISGNNFVHSLPDFLASTNHFVK